MPRESVTEKELVKIFEHYKTRNRHMKYDSIVAFSGGKDSCFALYLAKKKYGLRPLAVSADNGFLTERARQNMKRIIMLTAIITRLSFPSLCYSLLALTLLMGSSFCSQELNTMPKRWPGYAILGNGSICAVYSDDARLAPKSRLRGIRHFYYRDYTADYIAWLLKYSTHGPYSLKSPFAYFIFKFFRVPLQD